MNASFRTAFWAMCLGLAVPMVLFVGVELTSGGRARRGTSLVAADARGSLRTQLDRSAGNKSRTAPAVPARETNTGIPAPPGDRVVLDPPEVDPPDPQIVLGPDLETDPAAADPAAIRDHRVPVNRVAETRSKAPVLPEFSTSPIAIEARLAGIQQNLDKIGRAIDAQASREPPGDPIKQATELLKELHNAHLINPPAPQTDDQLAGKPDSDELGSKRTAKPSPAPATDTSSDAATPGNSRQKTEPPPQPQTVTRIYRPRYLSGSALNALISPLLTPNLGRAGAANAMGGDDPTASAGDGSSVGSADAVVVSDLPETLRKIDLLFQKLDAPPTEVAIEVVVLCFELNHGMPNGIDLAEFGGAARPFSIAASESGFPAGGSASAQDPLFLTRRYGLKRGILSGDPQAFISAVQAATQTRRVDAWQMTVVNRQSALLMLTDPFGPNGSGGQSPSGTLLKIRPTLARSGTLHLDVQRDAATEAAASGSRAAALTNQFSLREGQTAVIGGFMAEQPVLQFYRPSGFGQIPGFGGLFRRQMETIERTETIVLMTPRVVPADPDQQFSNKTHSSKDHGGGSSPPRVLPAAGAQARPVSR